MDDPSTSSIDAGPHWLAADIWVSHNPTPARCGKRLCQQTAWRALPRHFQRMQRAGSAVTPALIRPAGSRPVRQRVAWGGATVGQRSALRARPHAPRVRSARHAAWASCTSTGYVVVCIPVLRAGWTPSAPTAGWRFWM